MEKRGSHVGMILSFVIFITFVFFLYVTLQPTQQAKDKDSLLTYLTQELIKEISEQINIVTVSNTSSFENSCSSFNSFSTEIKNISILEITVKDKEGNILGYTKSGENIFINNPKKEETLWIYYYSSESDSSQNLNLEDCTEMKIDSLKKEVFIMEEKIISTKLKMTSEENYESLKTNFKFPKKNNFDFSFRFNNNSEIPYNQKEQKIDTYAKELPLQYFDKTASIKTGFINIKVW